MFWRTLLGKRVYFLFLLVPYWYTIVSVDLWPLIGQLCIPRMTKQYEALVNGNWQRTPKLRGQKPHECHFIYHKPIQTTRKLNQGLRVEYLHRQALTFRFLMGFIPLCCDNNTGVYITINHNKLLIISSINAHKALEYMI